MRKWVIKHVFYLLIKYVNQTIKNKAKIQKGGSLAMLLGTLGASFLGNLLSGKWEIRAGKGTTTVGQNFEFYLIL